MTRLRKMLVLVGPGVVLLVVIAMLLGSLSAARSFHSDAEAAHSGFVKAGAKTEEAQRLLSKDIRFTQLARAGEWALIERAYGPDAAQPIEAGQAVHR